MKAKAPEKMEFEEALQELEGIVASLEDRNIKLKDAVNAFERGKALADQCSSKLKEAENKIKIYVDGEFKEQSE